MALFRLMRRLALAALTALTAVPLMAGAQSPEAEQEAHRRIVAERAAAEQRYEAAERECRRRFVVSSCIDDAKRARHAVLVPLRERQIELDAAGRQRSAVERKASIAKKAVDDGARGGVAMSSRSARNAADAASAAVSSAAGATSAAPLKSREVAKPPTPIERAVPKPIEARVGNEAGNRAAFEARQQEAEQHRRDVMARNAERDAQRKPAKPLSAPPRSSGASKAPASAAAASSAR